MEKILAESIFNNFSKQNILIIGDVMVDAYLWGKVERISPEAPVPVVACTRRESRLGGAANVALNIKAMGARPLLWTVTGDDEKGKTFNQLLGNEGLENLGIMVDRERKTTVKTRVIAGSQQLLRVDDEDSSPLSTQTEKIFIDRLTDRIKNDHINAIIFQDYDKGVITPDVISLVIKEATTRNIPVLVDPKRRNFLQYKGATLFKPNFKEFREGLNISPSKGDFSSIYQQAKDFITRMNFTYLLLTLSEKGIFISNGKSFSAIPAHKRDITDVSGAGDTVISLATLCLAAGLKAGEIAAIANLAGGLVCEKIGVVPIDRNMLFAECLKLDMTNLHEIKVSG